MPTLGTLLRFTSEDRPTGYPRPAIQAPKTQYSKSCSTGQQRPVGVSYAIFWPAICIFQPLMSLRGKTTFKDPKIYRLSSKLPDGMDRPEFLNEALDRIEALGLKSDAAMLELRRLAKRGYLFVDTYIGYLYEVGFGEIGIPRLDLAYKHYSIAANRDFDPIGQFGVGRLSASGSGTEKNAVLAKQSLLKAADQDLPEACLLVGAWMMYGVLFEKDHKNARTYLIRARNVGYLKATVLLARLDWHAGKKIKAALAQVSAVIAIARLAYRNQDDPCLYDPWISSSDMVAKEVR